MRSTALAQSVRPLVRPLLRPLLRPVLRRGLSSAAPQRVSVTKHADGVVQVTLSRPDKMNALDLPMFRAIQQTARDLIADSRTIRAVVIHGDGRAFCAGLDVRSVCNPLHVKQNGEELLHKPEGEISNLAQDAGYLWRKLAAPVIAVTHGVCLGGGLQLALGADMRVSSPTCKFSVMESKWGLVPDMSATLTLPELVPKDVALELTLTGRIFQGEEALKLGLVTRLSESPLEEGLRLAREIASKSPDAAAAAKRLLHATYAHPDDQRNLKLESELQKRLIGRWNQGVSVAKGLGAPKMLTPNFGKRAEGWEDEADEEAEAELRAMLDGVDAQQQQASV
jgi:enoyl-CoA hydratase/carnithine racemase